MGSVPCTHRQRPLCTPAQGHTLSLEPGAGQAPCVWVCFTASSAATLAAPATCSGWADPRAIPPRPSRPPLSPPPNLGWASLTLPWLHSVRRQTGREPQGKHPSSWSPPCANSRGQTLRCLGPWRKGEAGAEGVGNDIDVTLGTWEGLCWDSGEWDSHYPALSTSFIFLQSVHFS